MGKDCGRVRRRAWAPVAAAVAAAAGATASLGPVFGQPAGALPRSSETGPSGRPGFTPPETDRPRPERPPEAAPRVAAPLEDTEQPSIYVTAFALKYAVEHPQYPALDDLYRETEVTLGVVPGGYAVPRDDLETVTGSLEAYSLEEPARYTSAALLTMAQAIRDELNRLGIVGVTVSPSELEFAPPHEATDPAWGKDLRQPGDGTLTFVVRTGVVTEMRTLAFGDRIPSEERVNNRRHAWILRDSPVQPYAEDDPRRKDVLRKDKLDDYVHRLNRHPGRRVDLSLAPGEEQGGVALDYLISESKPWTVYAGVSNTGTDSTSEWRERFGFLNYQLTGNDDILSLDFTTAGFDETNAFVGSYELPIYADWVRGRVYGSWNEFTASDLGQSAEDFTGSGFAVGGEVLTNVFQHREIFVDLVTGIRFQNVEVENGLTEQTGDEDFLIPNFGLNMERITDTAVTSVGVGFEFNLPDTAGTSRRGLEDLGRLDADEDFQIFSWDLSQSVYLEPLLFPTRWADTGPGGMPTLAHELFVSVRGQHSLGNRLIPNFEQTAGGMYTVRGYEESVAAGDNTVVGTLEYRFHLPQALGFDPEPGRLFGRTFRYKPQQPYGRADWDLVLKAFVDAGRTENADRKSFESDETLVGTGVGLDFLYKRNLNLRLDWGVALEEVADEVDSGDNRVHFSATILF